MRYLIAIILAYFSFNTVLFAFEEPLKDAYQEQRAKEIFKSLKCEVCQGQSVLDSESDFAKSVKMLVRENISKGLDDEHVYDVLKENYGQQISFRPPFDGETALLWLLPFILIFAGFIAVILVLRRNKLEPNQS
jgi:cytochrome c-type biogenesis protein CcmH